MPAYGVPLGSRLLLCVLLLGPVSVSAEAIVCGITATPDKFSRFIPSVDPTRFRAGSSETCAPIVGEAATAEQLTLSQAVPGIHIKVGVNVTIAGQVQPLAMLEMTAAEKQAVNDALAAQAANNQAWYQETQTPGVCKYNTPEQIDTKVDQVKQNNQNNINAMTLSAGDKNQLISVANRLTEAVRQAVKCDAARAGGG